MTNTWVASLLAVSVLGGVAAGRVRPPADEGVAPRPPNVETSRPSPSPPPRARGGGSRTCCAAIGGQNVCTSGSCEAGNEPTCRVSRRDVAVVCAPIGRERDGR